MKTPAYLLHKPTGQAYMRVGGKFHYLGRHGSPESHQKYQQRLSEWRVNGGVLNESSTEETTVAEVAACFLKRADEYNYKQKSLERIDRAMGGLLLYADTPAADFGPIALAAVRDRWVREDLSRGYVNALTNLVRAAFRHALSQELIPPGVVTRLEALENLKKGRCAAREGKARHAVSWEHVAATLPQLGPITRAMVLMQWHTGARPGEVCLMRPADIDRSSEVWEYRLDQHKNAHKGKERVIYIGPMAQRILLPFLARPPKCYCFCPKEAQAHFYARGKKDPPPVPVSGFRPYEEHAYNIAVTRAAKRAGLKPHWTPHQLRHAAGTRFKAEHGIEVAKTLLGHATMSATEIYAQDDRKQARAAAAQSA